MQLLLKERFLLLERFVWSVWVPSRSFATTVARSLGIEVREMMCEARPEEVVEEMAAKDAAEKSLDFATIVADMFVAVFPTS